MAKRIADKELTDRNWDQEEEGEEAGTFSVAPEDVMKNRAIKKAKRRNVAAEGEAGGGAFKGFKGFSMSASSTPSSFSTFGNGAGPRGSSALTNGSAVSAPPASAAGLPFNGSASSAGKEYTRQLTALNCSVRDWISKHVDDNPLCDLQPIFRDYERHLATVERQYGAAPAGEDKASLPACASFSFKGKADGSPAATFNFGQKSAAATFSSIASAASPPSAKAERPAASEEPAGDEAYEPPRPDVREIKEDDAFYSKKCKLFYRKDDEYKEKGVGTLHLKRTEGGKTQMIIRADTNLGNILLNILLSADVKCSRAGKNNVVVMCVPNPPVDAREPGAPVPLLLRVKTADDADQLHRTLEERKG
ncbi:nuclear pore complex protein Nup50 [Hippocampus zosterae]|uniref:nuclear pore complex protein Nup50 n=1 Tax=Hippocampus zosterae TaxID=109293 RepID=UPI00223E1002|nr:nuclear pore complex protein Nup50 [Hippocampus zosterae]